MRNRRSRRFNSRARDVIFGEEVVPYLCSLRCDYFTVAPHARESHDGVINSGVMLMNLARFRKTADEFYEFISEKLDELKAEAWDLAAYRRFIAAAVVELAALELNWRPC
jgi:hypothetical protein